MRSRRACIIHGWSGSPGEGWLPWLGRELGQRGFSVSIPAMPEPSEPALVPWLDCLRASIVVPDGETFLVGHSIGCQAILRFAEKLPPGSRVGGAVFVAGWMQLSPLALEGPRDEAVIREWFSAPLDFPRIRSVIPRSVAIFSDDDPYVPAVSAEIFKQELGAEIIVEHGKKHFSGSDGITELASARDAVLRCAGLF